MPNPFEQDVIYDPRRLQETVGGLNGSVLKRLIAEFEELAAPAPLPLWTPRKPILITSRQPGYGKSHLIGRLFAALAGRASLVYITPFMDAGSAWRSLLERIMQELRQPERIGVEFASADEPSQLEQFCHGIFVNITIHLLNEGVIETRQPATVIARLKSEPLKKLRQNERYLEWIQKRLRDYAGVLERTVRLHASVRSWLKIMFVYAYFADDSKLRETCHDWLGGGSVDETEARDIGLAPHDNPSPEITRGEANRICHERFMDFCQLARWHRPFVFCFDQTENYGNQEALARELGIVVERIYAEAANQMTILTANVDPWRERILRFWENAHQDRLREPLGLEGLNRAMAGELIARRLEEWPGGARARVRVLDEAWLDSIFKEATQVGIRQFLKLCRARWDAAPVARPSLEELFNKYFQAIRSKPDRRRFNRDALLWFVREVLGSARLAGVSMLGRGARFYELEGRDAAGRVLFGFEEGSHWKRWQAIILGAMAQHERDPATRVVMLRTAEQPVAPKPTWNVVRKMLDGGAGRYFLIVQLDAEETIAVNAMHDLYNDAVSGDVDYSSEEVLAFAAARLAAVLTKVLDAAPATESSAPAANGAEASPGSGEPTPALIDQVRGFVREQRLTTFDALLRHVGGRHSEEEIQNARGSIAEIKVYPTPNQIVLLWRP